MVPKIDRARRMQRVHAPRQKFRTFYCRFGYLSFWIVADKESVRCSPPEPGTANQASPSLAGV